MEQSQDPAIQALIEKNARFYESGEAIATWEQIKQRHRLRDERMMRSLYPHFRPGSVLELGAATGNLSAVLKRDGREVRSSDFSQAFVDHMNSIGLDAVRIDVTDPIAPTHGTWPMMIAQALSPLCMRDRDLNTLVLQNIHAALEPGGRLLCVFGLYRDPEKKRLYHDPIDQMKIATDSGLFRIVMSAPHQVLPPGLYRPWNAGLLNLVDWQVAKIKPHRYVWVMERI